MLQRSLLHVLLSLLHVFFYTEVPQRWKYSHRRTTCLPKALLWEAIWKNPKNERGGLFFFPPGPVHVQLSQARNFAERSQFHCWLHANVLQLDTCHLSTSPLAASQSLENKWGQNANMCVWRSSRGARISKNNELHADFKISN